MKSSDIRTLFIDYFETKNHHAVASSALVPANDPTLLFTNAGMVQFKNTFLGLETRPYTRAVSAQCCLRAGGKHNDLENVGYTARHHTFFEMLGNFSFGDYFKREAIQFSWEFLTEILKLPKEKLWVTVYKDDDEAADIWLNEIGVAASRLSRCGEKDNFWSMGDTGPCGPCIEIFYDHGPDIAGGPPGSPDEDGDRYIEIWNVVFMQYNRDKEGQLHPLPKPSVDTGMGLERIAAVVQGVHNNYDIDSFQHLIQALCCLLPKVDKTHPSLKVIADHIRACSFLIAEGVIPSNEGRGYVLRRIIRRAVRHGNKLGLPSPFFSQLVSPLVEEMGDAYPLLKAQQSAIERVLTQEEHQFSKTLEQGLRLLKEHISALKGTVIPGEAAFKLYDTYGFPLDLTMDIAREQQLTIDLEGFERAMEEQRAQSQAASHFQVDYSDVPNLAQETVFHGYDTEHLPEASVIALFVNNAHQKTLTKGMKATLVLEHTPFYAESGGQVGDKGILRGQQGVFRVDDTQRTGQTILHHGEMQEGTLHIGDVVSAEVDSERRRAIRLNHTATHLLHAALKQVVGAHIQQKGSLVDAERARFDFSHFEPLTVEELERVEALVNAHIRMNTPVQTDIMDIETAKQSGAVALFGEKYSESVRVLTMGEFSKELCGGTHANRTGDIGLFKITSEYGVASGVRRIEMVTGAYALAWMNAQLQQLQTLSNALKTTPEQAVDKLKQVLQETRQQEKALLQLQAKWASQSGSDLLSKVKTINGISVLIEPLKDADSKTLRDTLDQLKSKLENAAIVLYAVNGEKINVVAGISKPLVGKIPPAGDYVKALCGRGGGRDDMAQGGGECPGDLKERLEQIETMMAKAG